MAFQTKRSGPIEYDERPGAGPVLVLLHGIGSNAGSFAPLLPELPADWRVIAWNAPGYRGSAPLEGARPVAADYARALANFLDRLDLGSVFLLGHSLGALMTASFARQAPERVRALMLASCALGHGRPPGGPLSEAASARLAELEARGAEAFAAARAARLLYDPQADPVALARVQTAMAEVRMPGYAQAVGMLASGDLCADLAGLKVPAAVVCGAQDVVTPPEANRRAHAALPLPVRGALTLLPDAGHAVYVQAPGAFAAALVAHLGTV